MVGSRTAQDRGGRRSAHLAVPRGRSDVRQHPTWIWSVAVDGDLYVRAYNGQNSRWYRAAARQKAGRITAAGITKEVTFEPADGTINDRVDDAYRAKYGGSSYLSAMIGARARSATVKVMPRDTDSPQPIRPVQETAVERPSP